MKNMQLNQIDTNIKLGLERVLKGLSLLKIDPDGFESILIAGTNGKGTTAKYISKILKKHGKKTAVYTSPHLESPTERIELNSGPVDEKRLEETLKVVEKLDRRYRIDLTPFEIFTLAAFQIFKEEDPEILVCEVGMGGRLDATNILKNRYSVITTISLDHTEYLGESVESIAKEKAGVIKEGSIVVAGKMPPAAMAAVEKRAHQKRARLLAWNREIKIKTDSKNWKTALEVTSPVKMKALINSPLDTLAHNASLAITLCDNIVKLREDLTKEAIKNPPLPARGEVVEVYNKRIAVDVAHNPHGLAELLKSLQKHTRNLTILLAPLRDKEWKKMIKIASAKGHRLILIKTKNPRGLKPEDFQRANWIDESEISGILRETEGDVLIAGSFWIAKTARRLLKCQPFQDAKDLQGF